LYKIKVKELMLKKSIKNQVELATFLEVSPLEIIEDKT